MAFPQLWVSVRGLPVSVIPQRCGSGWAQPGKAKSPPRGAADLGTCRGTARRCFDLRVWEPPPQRGSEASPSQCSNQPKPCSPERRQTLHLIRGLNPPSCRGASFGNRKMSAGGVCPSRLRCQPQGQPQPPPPCAAGGLSCCFGLSTHAAQLWICTCIPPSCAGAAVLLSQYSSAALRSQTGASATTDDLQQGGYICIKSPENLAQSCAQADPWAY